ncbi:MAG: C1 family peptidase [Smithella sp.]|nr:C1 family peptidase [Smithella sp.]
MKNDILRKRLIPLLFMMFSLLLFCTFSFAAESDEIKAAVKAKGVKWIAGETSVSKLPSDQRKLRFGLMKPEMTGTEKKVALEAPMTALPSDLDWRNTPINYNSCVTSVRDQGNCGSCWAFATAGALESFSLIKAGCPAGDWDLAEQILLSCSRAGSCSGGYIDRASSFIRDTGLPSEVCFPYTAANSKCRNASCADWQLDTDVIGGWAYVATTSPSVEAIKNALNTYGPLVTTMDVYTDFFYYSGGIYSYATGNYEGGHAILIVGYSDSSQYFIAKNSWGTGWGEGGFFNIAYSQLEAPVHFGDYTIAYQEAACTYSISPTGGSFPATGGSGVVTVTANAGCSWNAVSNASWITIPSVESGSVGYNVAPNTKKPARTGTMSIAGKTFTVTQSGR